MKIYLVRHGQCNSNKKKIYNDKHEDLNEEGLRQAKDLKEKIRKIDFDLIISSPLKRAKHTAQIINEEKKIPLILDNRLTERDAGNLEGKPLNITNREEYWNYYTEIKYANEESIPDLFERVKSFLEELKEKNYHSVLIVAHSGISKAFYAYFNGIPQDGKFLELGIKNTEIVEYLL